MIQMTEAAAAQVKSVLGSKSLPEDTPLRVDLEATEEGNATLSLTLDREAPAEGDAVQETAGARLVVRQEVAELLGDSRLDYRDERFVLVPAAAQ